ncbi:M24 family metallopeptidase [Haloplanus sp. GCM10025708]|uniref:M24 family metallopeptidase n=1 Tax=Haloferacaceae TaxID=1644056 RepID=UPI00361B092C
MTPFERRTRAVQRRLDDAGADGLVLFPSRNLYYTASVDEEPTERALLLFVPASGDPVFVVPELSGEEVREATWVPDVRTWSDDAGPDAAIDAAVANCSLRDDHVLVDDTMWAQFTHDLRDRLPDATFGLASEVLSALRRRKDEAELAALRRAANVADAVVEDLRERGADVIGSTERDLARYVEERLAAHGGESVAFETIVGSGPNGAKPHHAHGDREIRAGDPVVLDFGTRVDAYPSDQTRTLVFGGDPSETFERVHALVREAQRSAVEAVEPGVTAGDVDDAARSIIERAGYGDEFVHRTGHGVGLSVHEEPYITADSDTELEAGMVFSVEPGVYLPGEFGVRIEDLVVVTEDGRERLNRTDRGWRC